MQLEAVWRFDSPGAIPNGVVRDFHTLIGKIAAQGDRKPILEHFKAFFAEASGFTSSWSSDVGWADTDLLRYMEGCAENAPLFIDAFYEACEAIRKRNPEFAIPDAGRLNRILHEHHAGYEIRPPNLVAINPHVPIPVPERTLSLDEQAQAIIQDSLRNSERLLSEGLNRQAVQEILWLLETVVTAYRGMATDTGTIQGKYFNRIAEELRRNHKGQMLDQVVQWATTLHGYLSSPTGGGVRHGTDLKVGMAVQPNDSRLLCNIIRSYITFFMLEHERLSKKR
jgi:hypothetical protein